MNAVAQAGTSSKGALRTVLTEAPGLTFNLQSKENGDLTVWSCELRRAHLHSRTIFSGYPSVSEALCAPLAREIEDQLGVLRPLGDGTRQDIVVVPDFMLIANRCVLSHLHLTRVRRPDGVVAVSVRIISFAGRLSDLLLAEEPETSGLESVADQLAFDVFNDLLMPIMNILTLHDLDSLQPGDAMNQKLVQLCRNSDALKMRIDLLQRLMETAPEAGAPGIALANGAGCCVAPRAMVGESEGLALP